MSTKQVIVVRSDLKLRRGKEAAQVAHASGRWLLGYALESHTAAELGYMAASLTPDQLNWLRGNYRKIVCQVRCEEELRDLHDEATNSGLTVHLITDDGLTECPPGTVTTLAIGPHDDEKFVGFTDGLELR